MSYIGSSAAPLPVAFSGVRTQSFSGTGSQTAFTLSRAVSAVTDIEVVVNNVQQSPFDSSYNISGATLTFSEAPSSGTNNIYVIFRDQPVGSLAPADASITPAKLDRAYVNKAGDTMTGGLALVANTSHVSTGDFILGRVDGYDYSFVVDAAHNTAGRGVTFQKSGGGAINAAWLFRGVVKNPERPAFCASSSNGSSSITAGSVFPFNTILGGNIGFDTGTSRFTCPTNAAGKYFFTTTIYSQGTTASWCFTRNGAQYGSGDALLAYKNGSDMSTTVSACIDLAAGDYVEVRARNTQGSNYYGPHSVFSGFFIG